MAYGLARLMLAPSLKLIGYRKTQVGRCVLWGPPSKLEVMLGGVWHLKKCDPELFTRLSQGPPIIFWYHSSHQICCGNIFTIPESYFLWNVAGVAARLLQSLAVLEAARTAPRTDANDKRRGICEQSYQWLCRIELPGELLDQYHPARLHQNEAAEGRKIAW